MTTQTDSYTYRADDVYRAGWLDGYHYLATTIALPDVDAEQRYQAGYDAGSSTRHSN